MRHKQYVIGIGVCSANSSFRLKELPSFGRAPTISNYGQQVGGPVATALVSLSRLGIRTRLIAKVGNDPEGTFIRKQLENEGVEVDSVEVEAGALSRVVLALVDEKSGERCYACRLSTCSPLDASELDRPQLASASILHLDEATDLSLLAARWAKEYGTPVVYDAGWPTPLVKELLPLVSIVIASSEFTTAYFPGATLEDAANALFHQTSGTAIVTRGADGCITRDDRGMLSFSAFPIAALDTTGAGDAFHAGYIYALLQGWELKQSIQFASAIAAINCTSLGGVAGLPRLAEVEQFLARQTFAEPDQLNG